MHRVAVAAFGRVACLSVRRVGSVNHGQSISLQMCCQQPLAAHVRQFHLSRPVAAAAGDVSYAYDMKHVGIGEKKNTQKYWIELRDLHCSLSKSGRVVFVLTQSSKEHVPASVVRSKQYQAQTNYSNRVEQIRRSGRLVMGIRFTYSFCMDFPPQYNALTAQPLPCILSKHH